MTLKIILQNCWTKIEHIYNQGNICSERHLQAEIIHILYQNKEFKKVYQIFVEPTIYSDRNDGKHIKIVGIIPDILIAQENKIVCVFEIKYNPSGYALYEKDIINFLKFNEIKETDFPIYLKTDTKTGEWDYKKPYTVDKNVLFAYGVIANKFSDALKSKIWKENKLIKPPITNYIHLIVSVN